jgi:RNA polymerase sigma factor (sigma-70 family)
MAGGSSVALLRDIQTLFDAGTACGLSDRQLLEQFALRRDATAEAAFEELVLRHGPMVWRVCRNVLPDWNDAQDAFQATFLVLVRRCGSVRGLESLGGWLYGVACRVAARARVEAARRRVIEGRAALRVIEAVESSRADDSDGEELGPIVQEEVRRLPEKYRAVVVLCYWEGRTQEQAAAQLGCPLGTVRSRLARARELLRRRLTRRGLAPLAGLVAAGLESTSASASITATVPNPLVSSTIKAAAQIAVGRAVADAASATVAALVQSVLRSMMMIKVKTVAIGLVLMGLGAWGVSRAAPQAGPGRSAPAARPAARPDPRKAQPPIRPLGSYVVEPSDLLLVEVLEALPGRPISGERLVRPDGKISLGFYGEIRVAGLTPMQIKEKVIQHLRKYLEDETLGIAETDENGNSKLDPKTGEPILIKDFSASDRVFVDVSAYNSKVYYVQGEVVVPGRLPVTGSETILDAINFAGGLTPRADHDNVVLYRQVKGGALQRLPVNIDQIMMGDDLSTNYQLEPGDRLVIPRLRETVPNAAEPEDERPTPAQPTPRSPQRHADPLHFDRPADAKPDRLHDYPRQATFGVAEQATLRRVEQRLGEVERKLDMILKALEPKTP